MSLTLDAALTAIADDFDFNPEALIRYAAEDQLGGYPDRCPGGSLWGVEGQTLYALVRHLHTNRVVEFGSWVGCSAAHIASALKANGGGVLTCVDPYPQRVEIPDALRAYVEVVGMTAQEWLPQNSLKHVGLVFEDGYHDEGMVETVWTAVRDRAPARAVVVSHDARHVTSQREVEAGMTAAVGDAWRSYLISPSDCGLGMWRKP